MVGGLSRTVRHNGYLFDVGGHRFYTKVPAVEQMWREVLGDDLLVRRRRSRILYRQKFFDYPLRPLNALGGLGVVNSMLAIASYLKAKLFPTHPDHTFEEWISNRFGARLYRTFFKSYTEKVWGIPCSEISRRMAEQRIRGLSFKTTLKHALRQNPIRRGEEVIKTLIHQFHYPRLGPGMMWERVAKKVTHGACTIELGAEGRESRHLRNRGRISRLSSRWSRAGGGGKPLHQHDANSRSHRERLPTAPDNILEAARTLRYRDFITVALVVDQPNLFPDNWIYVHDPQVRVGRIQNFKNWSPGDGPQPGPYLSRARVLLFRK